MAAKKMKKNPAAIAARVEGRKKFVGEARKKGVDAKTARKRYYVKTRSAEMTAAGKKADKAALRKKFESGGVSRDGFYASGDKKRGKNGSAARGGSTGRGSGMPPDTLEKGVAAARKRGRTGRGKYVG